MIKNQPYSKLKGRIPHNRGKTYEESYGIEKAREMKERLRLINLGEIRTEESKQKLKETAKNNPNYGMKNKHHSDKTKKKMSESHKGEKNYTYGKQLKEETRQKIRFKAIERLKNPEFKEKQIIATLKGLLKRPTSFEQKILLLCSKYRLPFIYTGDGRILIGSKNPDFINEREKILIEVFCSWFKIRNYGSVDEYKKIRKEDFESAGWKVIFLDEKDVMANNWEERCLNKINEVLIRNEVAI